MRVSADILSVLSCSECEVILSRSPVFQAHDGAALCGRCVKPERPVTRSFIYEASAKFLRFPCKNRDLGCRKTVPFAEEKEEIKHEVVCQYRQYLCPVVPRGQCDWLGRRQHLIEHCRTNHPDMVVNNVAQLTHDISTFTQHTYLLTALRALFLLHTKVCVSSGKIFHAVRYLGDPSKAAKFKFTVDVRRGEQLVSKTSPVAPPGCLAIQEETSMALYINSLLQILDGLDDAVFTVTVWDDAECVKCGDGLSHCFYPEASGWLCGRCAPPKRACKHKDKGCTFTDIDIKCENHELFFCPYTTHCFICETTIAEDTLNAHYSVSHGNVTHASVSMWPDKRDNGRVYHIATDAGIVRCRYWPNENHFSLLICCSLPSEQRHDFCCKVKLISPNKSFSKTYPAESFCSDEDWRLTVNKTELPAYKFDIYVTITRILSK